jgi:hypothetical protein
VDGSQLCRSEGTHYFGELNVLAHVVAKVVVYSLWWLKPLAVAHPMLLPKTGATKIDPN